MKKVVWCNCGCGEQARSPVLPRRAARLVIRRRKEAIREAFLAQQQALAAHLQAKINLAAVAPGGTA